MNFLYTKIPNKVLLWTNSNTSNEMSSGSVELSDELTKFSHILVQWYLSTTDTTMYEDIFKLQPLRSAGLHGAYFGMTCDSTSVGNTVTRPFSYTDSTHLAYYSAYYLCDNGTVNSRVIPYKIYGINLSY